MLGSHNSYTYKKALNKIFEAFNFLWRCQTKSLQDQYKNGVRYFDIRIYRKKNAWGFAHGLVNLYGGFGNLKALFQSFRMQYPNAKCRILLEKGNKELFIKEVKELESFEDFSEIVHQCIIKKNWEIVYDSNKQYDIFDYCYVPVVSGKSFWYNLKRFRFNTIRNYAKKHNPVITQEMLEDPNKIYFMDLI